jgi:hypothetical protein
MKVKEKNQFPKIRGFIQNDLKSNIRDDVSNFKILNERDLESAVYYQLRKFLKKKKNRNKELKISTNFTVTGFSVKKKFKGEVKFSQPDVMILEWVDDSTRPKMHIAMELKALSPGQSNKHKTSHYETLFQRSEYRKDFKKLIELKKRKIVNRGYFIFLYHDINVKNKEASEATIKRLILKYADGKFTPLVINRFEHPKHPLYKHPDKAEKFRHKSRQMYRHYVEGDPKKLWVECPKCGMMEHLHNEKQKDECSPKKKSSGKKNPAHVKRAKKAARTRKRNAAAKAKKKARTASRRKRNKRKGQ